MKLVSGRNATTTPLRRFLAAATSVAALVLGSTAALLVVTGGSAAASPAAVDLSVTQRISGSSTTGQTVDTLTIHNAGPSTANHVNLTMLLKSTSNFILTSTNHGTCETEPPPSGYLGLTTCQVGSMARGATVVETVKFTGQVGVAFSNFATVGEASPGDRKLSNNSNTKSSWFGPRADLAVGGTSKPGKNSGRATAVTTVVNHGPNAAKALQLIVEIKSAGLQGDTVSATPLSSCQTIPPSSGNDGAVSCVTDSLGTGKKWVLTFKYSGAAGARLTMTTNVSANTPADPVSTNNHMTRKTRFKS
jgi:hypothetical protein